MVIPRPLSWSIVPPVRPSVGFFFIFFFIFIFSFFFSFSSFPQPSLDIWILQPVRRQAGSETYSIMRRRGDDTDLDIGQYQQHNAKERHGVRYRQMQRGRHRDRNSKTEIDGERLNELQRYRQR